MKHATNGSTNRMRFAGSWYPRSAGALGELLGAAFDRAAVRRQNVHGAILPHAGLAYSADGMAAGFARVTPEAIDRVVLFAPSHYVHLISNTLYSAPFETHETPIGPIPGVAPPDGMDEAPDALEQEHAVELLLPFVRYTLPDVPLLAVLVPEITTPQSAELLADTLFEWLDAGEPQRTLFLASSDFTHYGPRFRYTPFGVAPLSEVEARVAADDRAFATAAAEHNTGALYDRMTDGPISICGRYPIVLLATVMKRLGFPGTVAGYYTSNSIHARSQEFVCYASVVYAGAAA